MNTLAYTLMILSVMATLTWTKLATSTSTSLLSHQLTASCHADKQIDSAYQTTLFDIYSTRRLSPKPSTKPRKQTTVSATKPRPKKVTSYPALLDLSPCLYNTKGAVISSLFTEIALDLFDELYSDSDGYSRHAGEEILSRLQAKFQGGHVGENEFQGKPTLIHELAAIDLEDDSLQTLLAKMLDRMVEYVTIGATKSKINIIHAPLPLIKAVFQDKNRIDMILECRDSIIHAAKNQEETSALEHELKVTCTEILKGTDREPLIKALDFSLKYKPPYVVVQGGNQKRLRRVT